MNLKSEVVSMPPVSRKGYVSRFHYNWKNILDDLEKVPAKAIIVNEPMNVQLVRASARSWWSYNKPGTLRTSVDGQKLTLWVDREMGRIEQLNGGKE